MCRMRAKNLLRDGRVLVRGLNHQDISNSQRIKSARLKCDINRIRQARAMSQKEVIKVTRRPVMGRGRQGDII